MALTDKQHAEVHKLLIGGNPLEAVRLVESYTGWDSARAKIYVYDELRVLQQSLTPTLEKQPRASAVTPYDNRVLSNIEFWNNPVLAELEQTQKEITKLLAGANYAVTLQSKGVRYRGEALPLCEAVHVCFPEADLNVAKFLPTTAQAMVNHVNDSLRYEGDVGSGPLFNAERRNRLEKELIALYWDHVWRIVGGDRPQLLRYSDCLFGYPVFWDFAYVLNNATERRCLVIAGLSSD